MKTATFPAFAVLLCSVIGCSHGSGSSPSGTSSAAMVVQSSTDMSITHPPLSDALNTIGISQYPGSTLDPEGVFAFGPNINFGLVSTDSIDKLKAYYEKELSTTFTHDDAKWVLTYNTKKGYHLNITILPAIHTGNVIDVRSSKS